VRAQLGFRELADAPPEQILIVRKANVHLRSPVEGWPTADTCRLATATAYRVATGSSLPATARIVSSGMPLARSLCAAALLLAIATPAAADATVFVGTTSTPANRTAKGFAVGAGLLVVAFEFEYASTGEDLREGAPSLRTGMGNVLLQTPFAVMGLQPYFTTGGGLYRERLEAQQETHVGISTGAGVKISLLGPVRARIDYRVFKLRGDPLHDVVHRAYAGLNVRF
jgi:hypothetical protein